MRTTVAVITGLCLALTVALSAQSVRRVDLTRPDVVKTRPSTTGGAMSGLSGIPNPQLPLAIRLVSTDRPTYRRGDPIVYEVQLTNNGAASFAVPTSLDHRAFEHLDEVAITMTVSLEVPAGDQAEAITALSIVGAPKESGSMQTLAAGESLILKIPSEIWRQPSQRLKTSGEFQVRARVDLGQSTKTFAPAVSGNTLNVALQLGPGR